MNNNWPTQFNRPALQGAMMPALEIDLRDDNNAPIENYTPTVVVRNSANSVVDILRLTEGDGLIKTGSKTRIKKKLPADFVVRDYVIEWRVDVNGISETYKMGQGSFSVSKSIT